MKLFRKTKTATQARPTVVMAQNDDDALVALHELDDTVADTLGDSYWDDLYAELSLDPYFDNADLDA